MNVLRLKQGNYGAALEATQTNSDSDHTEVPKQHWHIFTNI